MTSIDTSFFTDMFNDLLTYIPVLQNIATRYTTVVNFYSYLFIGLMPFYLYADPYFLIKNFSHIYLTFCCCAYLYNRSNIYFFQVPTTFILDSFFKLSYDSIVYIMVFVTIATGVEIIYTTILVFKSIVTNNDFHNFINLILENDEQMHDEIDEYVEEPTEEHSEEESDEQSSEQPSEQPTDESTEQPSEQPTEESTEQPTEESTEQPTEESTEQPTEESTEQPSEQPSEQPTEESTEQPADEPIEQPISKSEITPVDDDLSDLPELI